LGYANYFASLCFKNSPEMKKGTKTSFEQVVDVPFEKKLQESRHLGTSSSFCTLKIHSIKYKFLIFIGTKQLPVLSLNDHVASNYIPVSSGTGN
jgi:hypothetical protein